MLLFIRSGHTEMVYQAGFKYISCYSLSTPGSDVKIVASHSNTSHVTLYPLRLLAVTSRETYSNTSHVTLYQIGVKTYLC